MKKYVVGFCFDRDWDNVLLVRKARPVWQVGKLNGIGGKVREGENRCEAMRRVFLKETGGRKPNVVWRVYAGLRGVDQSGEAFEVWFFHARESLTGLDGVAVNGEVLGWFPVHDLARELVVHDLLYFVPMAKLHSLGLGLYSDSFVEVTVLAGEPDGK